MGRVLGRSEAADTVPPDFYRMLQVDPDAPLELVVEAYWHLVRRMRDGRTGKRSVRDRIDMLNEAYATLISRERREDYDLALPRVAKLRAERARAAGAARKRRFMSDRGGKRRGRGSRGQPDYYAVLRLDPSAEPAIVDRAYTVLRVLQSESPVASPAELAEAHAVLADPELRAAYDASPGAVLEAKASPPADAPAQAAPAPPSASSVPDSAESRGALAVVAAAVRAVGRATWRGLVIGARLSRRFVRWAWPIARVRSKQFAAWAWPIIRRVTRWLAVHAWLATKVGAKLAARATRQGARSALDWWREYRGTAEPVEDWTVRSRLSREAEGAVQREWRPGSRPQDAAPRTTARLTVEQGPRTGAFIEVQGEPVSVGAAEKCDLRLPGDEVEAEHARIWPRQGRFIIRQLGGRPCISVDGRAVPWAVLEDGDRIEIGPHVVRFQIEARETNTLAGLAAPADSGGED